MTGKEMHVLLAHNLQQLGGYGNKSFTPSERNLFLKLAVDRFIKNRVSGNNPLRQGLEVTNKRISDLRTVLKVDNSLGSVANNTAITNAKVYTIPDDFYIYVFAQAKVTRGSEVATWYPADPITHKDLPNYLVSGTDNEPIIKRPGVLTVENRLFFLVETNHVIENIELHYIKEPVFPDESDKEYTGMPNSTHMEIVEEATVIIKERTERQSYQTAINELKRAE